jgi:hypothetical protein
MGADASPDPVEVVIDHCIRRGLGFAGLAVGLVMLSLSFDLPLALRSGAGLVAVVAGAMLVGAWQAPRRDMRHSEAWVLLDAWRPEVLRGRRLDVQDRLRRTLRRRLMWHAERVGLLALGLWGVLGLVVAGQVAR